MDHSTFHFSPRENRAHDIHWREWGQKAFDEAQREQKPLLLAISAVWCHWCHVMDETTYSDPAIIQDINEHFIPVRVDNDQRPDINIRYNMGGWPSTAFLTPSGEVLTGATYVPPEQMQELLPQVRQYYQENREALKNQTAPVELLEPDPHPKPASSEGMEEILNAVRSQFDRAYGGIGQSPKFPHPDVWELCLSRFVAQGEGWAAGMAVRTMDAMAGGGMADSVAGGFFRYSTTREWTVPHYEKLLEDNARLATLFLHGYQIMGDESYRDIARQTLSWMQSALLQPSGLFGGSQDADEEYYRLAPEEREGRPAPYVDPTVYAGWNALAAQAMMLASVTLGENWRATAFTCLEALFIQLWDDDQGLSHDASGLVQNWLSDLTQVGLACLDAYELTGDPEHLSRAERVMSVMDRELTDKHPGFFDRPKAPHDIGRLKRQQKPLGENGEACRFLYRLGRLTGNEPLMERARGILGAFEALARRFGIFAAHWALAETAVAAPPLDAVLVTDEDHRTDGLRQAVAAIYDLNRAVFEMDVDDPEREARGYRDEPLPSLYLCRGTACAAPVTEPEEVINAFRTVVTQQV